MATKEIQYYKNGGSPFITISSAPDPNTNTFGNPQQSKDVHFYHYYNSRNNNSPSNSVQTVEKRSETSQQSYFVVAHITYGRLTAIDPVRSTPGVGGLPSEILSELHINYAHIPNALVIIINNNGKFTIQVQIVSDSEPQQNGVPQQTHQLPLLQNALPPNALPQPLGFPPPQNDRSPRFYAQNQQGQYPIPGQFPMAQQGQPMYYHGPGGHHRQRAYVEETPSDSDSGSGSEYDTKHRRRRRRNDGGRTYLQRKYSEIYHDDDDEAEHNNRRSGRRDDRGRNDRHNRDQRSARSQQEDDRNRQDRRTPGNIYRTSQVNNKNRDADSRLESRVLGDRR